MAENDNIEERLSGDEKDVEDGIGWETLTEAGVRTYWKKNNQGSWEKVKKESKPKLAEEIEMEGIGGIDERLPVGTFNEG